MDNNTFFTATHEWVKFLDDTHAEIGITDYAQHALGDIVFVNLPEIGDALSATQRFGDVESVKAVSDLISPVDGVVSAVNDALNDAPETLNSDAMGTWILKADNVSKNEGLLTWDAYQQLLAQGH
ncbi:MAG: glycine cleavage system protein GcvH [Erysipelotrichaceae bacterium]|nr:glycine cleavage system protein GcvH [Erysipelotrichaceae bacterium]